MKAQRGVEVLLYSFFNLGASCGVAYFFIGVYSRDLVVQNPTSLFSELDSRYVL
jgi:hypothetical protein